MLKQVLKALAFSLFLLQASGCAPKATCKPLTAPLADVTSDAANRVKTNPTDQLAAVFNQSELQTFELNLSKEDLAFLDAQPSAEKYVRGSLTFQETTHQNVGIRYKGSAGAWYGCLETPKDNPFDFSGPKKCPKLNIKVSFSKYDPDGRFLGVKKLQFHAMNADSSMMREKLSYWLFNQMGVPAPRTTFVRLQINGSYSGVYLLVENIDGSFVKSRFADDAGTLFKEAWPAAHPDMMVMKKSHFRNQRRTNKRKKSDFKSIFEFAKAIQSSGDDQAAAIQQFWSLDHLGRYMAVDRAIANDDGPMHFYCGEHRGKRYCGNHNFYLYQESNADRFWLIPWDLDKTFTEFDSQSTGDDWFLDILHEWDDHNVTCKPHPGRIKEGWAPWQMPPSCDPLINGFGCHFHTYYRGRLKALLDGPYSKNTIEAQLVKWTAMIAQAQTEAHRSNPKQLAPKDWKAGVEDLKRRIQLLRERAISKCAQSK